MRVTFQRSPIARRILWVAFLALTVSLVGVQAAGGSRGSRLASSPVGFDPSSVGLTQQLANQPALDAAADDAQSIAGGAYYTDAVVDDAANTVDVYLASAPKTVLDRLAAAHPGDIRRP